MVLKKQLTGPRRRTRRVSGLVATLFLLGACAKNTVVSEACTAFQPIYDSAEDTAETQAQVVEHNAAWATLCDPMAGN